MLWPFTAIPIKEKVAQINKTATRHLMSKNLQTPLGAMVLQNGWGERGTVSDDGVALSLNYSFIIAVNSIR